jgi:alpha,alpha-trehalase
VSGCTAPGGIISRSSYDGLIFDLDGVITRTARVHAGAWKKMFDEYLESRDGTGYRPFDADEDYKKYVDGKPRYEGVRSFLESRGIGLPYGSPDDGPDVETICGLGNRKNALFVEVLHEHGVDVFSSSVDLIMDMKSRGFKIAVASSSKNCAEVLDAANLSDLFEVRVDGVDIESLDLKGKPDPDMFLEAARRLEVDPGRSVVFEDAISGVEAGRRGDFGLVVGVNREDQREALENAGADIVVDDLERVVVEVCIEDLRDALSSFDEIEERLENKQVVVFLDYDGTLTPIVSRPEDAVMSEEVRGTVEDLSSQCMVAIISGRGLSDVKGFVGLDRLYYAGSHGFEIRGPGGLSRDHEKAVELGSVLEEITGALTEELSGVPGAQIERKKFSIAAHYRNVPEGRAEEVERAVDRLARDYPQFRKTEGKKVFELQPDIDWDKGKAIEWLLDTLSLARPDVVPFYLGDDITDEDAFGALRKIGISVVVGKGGRDTKAQYRLEDTTEVKQFLDRLTKFLEKESTWWLVFDEYDPPQEGLREALCTLGNGYFATRGASFDSEDDGVHYPGTYLAGGYNRLKTDIAGRVIENEDLVNIPNWICFTFRFPGGDWFRIDDVEIVSYSQELDLKNGVLHRNVQFRDDQGKETRVFHRRLVSMANMHLAAMETTLVPVNWSGELEIRSGLDGKVINNGVPRYRELKGKHLEPVDSEKLNEDTVILEMCTNQSRLDIAMAARVQLYEDEEPVSVARELVSEPGYIGQQMTVELEENSHLVVEKVVSLFNSRDRAISEPALEAAKALLEAERFGGLLRTHEMAWSNLWERFRVELQLGSSAQQYHVQRILRLYSFHLLQTASMHSLDIDVGMPSRGWHGEAYRGHIFWDELIIFPFLNFRTPQITRALLMYRFRRLPEARKAAERLGYKGVMYPWQSGSNGREETQQVHLNPESGNWLPDNSHLQRHINAAIVYNVWQYYQVTGDIEFLSWYGAEMIIEIARFWASLAEYNRESGRYEINGVMGPDEYHDSYPGAGTPGLNNNAYTNVMVVFVMNRTLELMELLPDRELRELRQKLSIEDVEIERWKDISSKMKVVFQDGGIISQFEGYDRLKEFEWDAYRKKYGNIQRLDRILEAEGDSPNNYKVSKQADVLMLFYLFSAEQLEQLFTQLGYEFDPEIIPRNIDYYLERTSNGSSLSWIIHSWVAARRDRAQSWELFNVALLTDFVDIQGGTTPEGIHLGAMAGCVDMMQRGYTGLESRRNTLRFNPEFPEEMDGLSMHIRYRGHWLNVEIESGKLRIEALGGPEEPILIEVDDTVIELREGGSAEVSIT